MYKFKEFLLEYQQIEIPFEPPIVRGEQFNITPNKSRSSGLGTGLVYLTSSKPYAYGYANGYTKSAHVFGHNGIIDGVLFYVKLEGDGSHYGGDAWISGFKDDIINNLKDYVQNPEETYIEKLTRDVLNACGIYSDDSEYDIKILKKIISDFKKDNLSWISLNDWTSIQDEYQGYSEICVKSVSFKEIVKIEVFKGGELIKEIYGDAYSEEYGDLDAEDCYYNDIYFHGSPLEFWKEILLKN